MTRSREGIGHNPGDHLSLVREVPFEDLVRGHTFTWRMVRAPDITPKAASFAPPAVTPLIEMVLNGVSEEEIYSRAEPDDDRGIVMPPRSLRPLSEAAIFHQDRSIIPRAEKAWDQMRGHMRSLRARLRRGLAGSRSVQISVRIHEDLNVHAPEVRSMLKKKGYDRDTTYTFTQDVRIPKGTPKPIVSERAHREAEDTAVETHEGDQQAYANTRWLQSASAATKAEARAYMGSQGTDEARFAMSADVSQALHSDRNQGDHIIDALRREDPVLVEPELKELVDEAEFEALSQPDFLGNGIVFSRGEPTPEEVEEDEIEEFESLLTAQEHRS